MQARQSLDPDKLLTNATTSIRHGIEDFLKSNGNTGLGADPSRSLSAVRNLFAGVLLLFKYKLATVVSKEADIDALLYGPAEFLPHPDGHGSIVWRPSPKFKRHTINVDAIKGRFEALSIVVDWNAIGDLQNCRNHIEHLHPQHSHAQAAGFVANLFPVLAHFIENELNMDPVKVLGEAWSPMVQHSNLFQKLRATCDQKWGTAGIPPALVKMRPACECTNCGSILIEPSKSNDKRWSVRDYPEEFKFSCMECGHSDQIAELLLEQLDREHWSDPSDGEPLINECDECGQPAFVYDSCHWCDAKLQQTECSECGRPPGEDHEDLGSLCGFHYSLDQQPDSVQRS